MAYTENYQWRNRAEFFSKREKIKAFLKRKWAKELDYRLKKELWSFTQIGLTHTLGILGALLYETLRVHVVSRREGVLAVR